MPVIISILIYAYFNNAASNQNLNNDIKPTDDEIAMKMELSLDNPEIDDEDDGLDVEDGPQWGIYFIHPLLNETVFFQVDKKFMDEYGARFNYTQLDPVTVPNSGDKSGAGSMAGGGGASPGGRGNSPREKKKKRCFCPSYYFLRKHNCQWCSDGNDALAFTNRRVEEAYAQVR